MRQQREGWEDPALRFPSEAGRLAALRALLLLHSPVSLKPAFGRHIAKTASLLRHGMEGCEQMTPEIDSYCTFHILFGHLLGHCLLPSTM